MAKKPSIRDTEAASDASGVDRYFAPEPEQPVTPAPAPTWEQLHKRWTFHVPVDVLDAVDAEAKRTGRTKTAVVVTLLREGLKVPDKHSAKP